MSNTTAKKFRLVVLANAQPGRDDEFNAWHSEVHLPEVVRAAGFTRGERMRLVEGSNGEAEVYRYLITFEGEGDQPMDALMKLGAAADSLTQSDTLGTPMWSSLYEAIPGASTSA